MATVLEEVNGDNEDNYRHVTFDDSYDDDDDDYEPYVKNGGYEDEDSDIIDFSKLEQQTPVVSERKQTYFPQPIAMRARSMPHRQFSQPVRRGGEEVKQDNTALFVVIAIVIALVVLFVYMISQGKKKANKPTVIHEQTIKPAQRTRHETPMNNIRPQNVMPSHFGPHDQQPPEKHVKKPKLRTFADLSA